MHCGTSMAILRKSRYDFSHLATGTSQAVVLHDELDSRPFYHIQLIVRVHARSFSGGQNFTFAVHNALPSEEDARSFVDTSALLTVPIVGGTGAGVIPLPGIGSASASNPGAFLRVLMTANQDPTAAGTFYAELSAELVLRPA